MRLFGDQNDHATPSGALEFAHRALRQRAVEIGQQRGVIENAFQLGAHKEATGAVIDELIVLDDVQLVLVANVGDLGDKALGVRADGA